VHSAARRAGLKDGFGVRRIEPELTWPEQLLLQLRSANASLRERMGWAPGGLGAIAQHLLPLDREVERWARLASPYASYAYCFCSVE
jgi:hypothetical protein